MSIYDNSSDFTVDGPVDRQQRLIFASNGQKTWELYRQPDNVEFGIYNESTGEIVLKFNTAGKPVVSGSWADGSAAQSVLAALVTLGLVKDATTE